MEQRRLRLGDNVDDYCPRERRITTHAIVAMVADDVKQTRCTACDAEHEYKAAKAPPKRGPKVMTAAALGAPAAPARPVRPADSTPTDSIVPDPTVADPPTADPALAAGAEPDEGPVRRPLIERHYLGSRGRCWSVECRSSRFASPKDAMATPARAIAAATPASGWRAAGGRATADSRSARGTRDGRKLVPDWATTVEPILRPRAVSLPVGSSRQEAVLAAASCNSPPSAPSLATRHHAHCRACVPRDVNDD